MLHRRNEAYKEKGKVITLECMLRTDMIIDRAVEQKYRRLNR